MMVKQVISNGDNQDYRSRNPAKHVRNNTCLPARAFFARKKEKNTYGHGKLRNFGKFYPDFTRLVMITVVIATSPGFHSFYGSGGILISLDMTIAGIFRAHLPKSAQQKTLGLNNNCE